MYLELDVSPKEMVLTIAVFAVGANGSGKTNFFSGKAFGTKLALTS